MKVNFMQFIILFSVLFPKLKFPGKAPTRLFQLDWISLKGLVDYHLIVMPLDDYSIFSTYNQFYRIKFLSLPIS